MSINRVNISGNLTRDPEFRQTPSGTGVLTFGVAVNDRRRNQQTGEWEEVPNFVDCVVFGNRAEPLSRFLSKGMKVAIEGKLRWSQWERDGQKRSKLEVIVDEVEFLSQRNAGGQQGAPVAGGYAQPQQQAAPAPQQGYAAQVPPVQTPPAQPATQVQAPAPQRPPVQAPPSADVYDEDIPF